MSDKYFLAGEVVTGGWGTFTIPTTGIYRIGATSIYNVTPLPPASPVTPTPAPSTKHFMVYQSGNTGDPKAQWIAAISDVKTGHIEQIKHFPTEDEARKWGESIVNGNVPLCIMPVTKVGAIRVVSNGVSWNVLDEVPDTHSKMEYYGSSPPALKCKCWVCNKMITPSSQYYDFSTGKYKINIQCHGESETIQLTEDQIKKINEGAEWQAFLC